jgi:hypothetical protein
MVANVPGSPVNAPVVSEDRATNGDSVTQRQRKLLELVAEAEANLDALAGSLTIVSADLMALMSFYRAELDQLRARIRDPRQRLELLLIVTEPMYKLSKQIDSFANTAARLDRERQRARSKEIESTA